TSRGRTRKQIRSAGLCRSLDSSSRNTRLPVAASADTPLLIRPSQAAAKQANTDRPIEGTRGLVEAQRDARLGGCVAKDLLTSCCWGFKGGFKLARLERRWLAAGCCWRRPRQGATPVCPLGWHRLEERHPRSR